MRFKAGDLVVVRHCCATITCPIGGITRGRQWVINNTVYLSDSVRLDPDGYAAPPERFSAPTRIDDST